MRDSLTATEPRPFRGGLRRVSAQFDVAFEVSPRLVRGLDYYTNTVFEIVSAGLGAQNAICGGGAYEGLVEELGGPPTYGVGFAIGEDRLLDVLPADSPARRAGLFLAVGPVVVTASERLSVKEGRSRSDCSVWSSACGGSGFRPSKGQESRRRSTSARWRCGRPPSSTSVSEDPATAPAMSRILATGERRELDESELGQMLKGLFSFTGAFRERLRLTSRCPRMRSRRAGGEK